MCKCVLYYCHRVTTKLQLTNISYHINPGVVAAINLAGVRGDPCGAVRWTAVQCTAPQRSPRTPATCIAATTPGLMVRILNSVFF